ncbi:Uncharacterized protein FWK35_00009700 [Aphis craccivora]|uniref:Uncharacterized protein n=1 Tax=Aphis craccivora TaxID=307492 RepID=A0A6G0YWG3_APHCR|nr:Uncharacterized protein FWK35_00009700 [Aphis craccivora]
MDYYLKLHTIDYNSNQQHILLFSPYNMYNISDFFLWIKITVGAILFTHIPLTYSHHSTLSIPNTGLMSTYILRNILMMADRESPLSTQKHSERSDECIDFTMLCESVYTRTCRNNGSIFNYSSFSDSKVNLVGALRSTRKNQKQKVGVLNLNPMITKLLRNLYFDWAKKI